MKKNMLFTAAIIVFCTVSIPNTQAMQHQTDGHNKSASKQPHAALSGLLLARADEHDTSVNKNEEQQTEKNIWSKDEWGDAEYPEDEYNTDIDKKKNRHREDPPWSKDEWGDAEYPEDEYNTNIDKKENRHREAPPWSKDEWGDAEYPED